MLLAIVDRLFSSTVSALLFLALVLLAQHFNSPVRLDGTVTHPFFGAIEQGSVLDVERVLDGGSDISALRITQNQLTVLHWAAINNHRDIVVLLIGRGVAVDAMDGRGRTALSVAAELGHVEMAQLLLDKGADVDAMDYRHLTPLHWAMNNGNETLISLLLHHGASAKLKCHYGVASFHRIGTHKRALKALLLHHPKLTRSDFDSLEWDSLRRAVYTAKLEAVRDHLNLHYDSVPRDLIRFMPLHYAVVANNAEITALLVNWQPVDERDFEGQTALHVAVQLKRTELIPILLRHGASVSIKDRRDQSPLELAQKDGDVEIVTLLSMAENTKRHNRTRPSISKWKYLT